MWAECTQSVQELQAYSEVLATSPSSTPARKGSQEINERDLDLAAKAEVEEAEGLEWETLVDKGAVIIFTGLQARQARLEHSCRILKSRFVLAD